MKTENLIIFIENQLDQGTKEEVIRETLLKAGYLPIEIDKAFDVVRETRLSGSVAPQAAAGAIGAAVMP